MKQPDYAGIYTMQDARDLAEMLLSTPERVIGFDIETGYHGPDRANGSTDPDQAFVVGFSITNSPFWARYIPLRHAFGVNLPAEEVWEIFQPVLENSPVVAHNAGFEERFMAREGIALNIFSDTMLEAHALGRFEEIGLKPLSKALFKYDQAEITSLWPKPAKGEKVHKSVKPPTRNKIRFNIFNSLRSDIVAYACDDAALCLKIHNELHPQVKNHPTYALEMGVLPITIDMEDRGVALDFNFLRIKDLEAKALADVMAEEVKDGLAELAGVSREELNIIASGLDEESLTKLREKGKPVPEMNLGSTDQLRRVIFDHVGLTTRHKTDTGQMSTGELALKGLAKSVPVIGTLLTYRSVVKMSSSYCGKWYREYQDHPTGRAHPSWKQTAVPSGRWSATDPPVQTMPKKFEFESRGVVYKGNFRDCIVAAPGFYLLGYDYSQIELRVIAALAKEMALVRAFDNDEDVHLTTADLMGITRDEGKTMNFGLMYQMGVPSLADRLGISKSRAQYLYNTYFETYSNIADWVEEMQFVGESRRWVETHFGRRVPIWEFQYAEAARARGDERKARGIYGNAKRLCVNAPVQGSAADYMKMAMIRAREALKAQGWYGSAVYPIINVHDELQFEVSNDLNPLEVREVLRPAVEFPVEGWPKIVTEWETGQTWGTMEAIE